MCACVWRPSSWNSLIRSTWWYSVPPLWSHSRSSRSSTASRRKIEKPVFVMAAPSVSARRIPSCSSAVMSYHSLVHASRPSASKKRPPLSTTASGRLPHRVASAPEITCAAHVSAGRRRSMNGSSPKATATNSASEVASASCAARNAPPVPSATVCTVTAHPGTM